MDSDSSYCNYEVKMSNKDVIVEAHSLHITKKWAHLYMIFP